MNTTIAVSSKVRDQIKEYGHKGETYDDILSRLLANAKERQLQELLLDTSKDVLAKDALEKSKKKWQ